MAGEAGSDWLNGYRLFVKSMIGRGGVKISGKFDNSLPVYGRYGGDGYGEREKKNKWIFLFAGFWYTR